MNPLRHLKFALLLLLSALASARAEVITATYSTGTEVPVTADGYTATGNTVNFTLNFTPSTGTELMVVKNTGLGFINGVFDNLAQAQDVLLPFGGVNYRFVASYYGGSGNDLVLVWKRNRVFAWGGNGSGQLGDGTTIQRNQAVPVTATGVLAGRTVVSLAAGQFHSVALCSDGTVATWGQGGNGALGTGTTADQPVPVAVNTTQGISALSGKRVVAIAAGQDHCLALCSDGTVAAWGRGNYGQIGNNATSNQNSPVAVNTTAGTSALAGKTVVTIAAGAVHCLALCSDGTLVAWGDGGNGNLGNNSTTSRSVPVLVNTDTGLSALSGRTVSSLAAGLGHSMALCTDGSVVSWGLNSSGQLGNNSTTQSLLPVLVSTGSGVSALFGKTVVSISAGDAHNLALCSDGSVAAWGDNSSGMLGDGTTTQRNAPMAVSTAPGASALAGRTVAGIVAQRGHSLALCADGTLASWGVNSNGQLGDSSTTQRNAPVMVASTPLSAGEQFCRLYSGQRSAHTLALAAGPPVPEINVTGNGTDIPAGSTTPSLANHADFGVTPATGDSTITRTFTIQNNGWTPLQLTGTPLVSVSGPHAADFTVTAMAPATVAVDSPATFQVTFNPGAVGSRVATITIASDDTDEASYDFTICGTGLGAFTAAYSTGTEVPVEGPAFTATGSTINFTLNYAPVTGTELMVVKNTGLGFINGVFDNLAQGQEVTLPFGDIAYRFVANYHGGSGNDLVLIWKRNRVFGWGGNNVGQLGDGTTTQRNLPVLVNSTGVLAGKTVLQLATGNGQCVALCSDGTLAAWGHNNYGQLGDNSVSTRNAPVAVNTTAGVSALSGKRVVSVAAGYQHCLALCSDGTVAAWGDNGSGQLGDNTTAQRLVPTAVNVASGVSALFGKTVVAVAAGSYHSMALCSDGTVAAWGNNTHGEIGDGSVTQRNAPVAVNMAPGSALFGKVVVAVAAGSWHNLALASDGTLAAWGLNSDGQCGIFIGGSFSIPAAVSTTQGDSVLFGRTVTAIVGGDAHSVVLCSDGVVTTFGNNSYGQLGDNSTTARRTPVAMSAAEGVSALFGRMAVALGAAYNTSMALCSDGSITACGLNNEGQIGDNSVIQRLVPVAVNMTPLATGERFIAITRGRSRSVFALAAAAPTPADIAIEQPPGTDIANDSSLVLNVMPGNVGDLVFTLKNMGDTHLHLTGSPALVALTGTSEFSVTAQPAAFVSADSLTTFTIRFAPADMGAKNAVLSIPSNDPDENPFTLNLIGAATTPPTDITLSPGSIPENAGTNATVGTLTTDDPDVGDTATFTLVSGTGSTDNASFTITGSSLILQPSGNFESKSSYALRVRVTDAAGAFYEEAFTIAITDVNEPPSFTKGVNQSLLSSTTTPQSVTAWATALNDGDTAAVQSFTFNVSNDNNALFTVQPAISSDGTLSWTPSGTVGTAIVTVTLTDDASINDTPALTSAAQTFGITISGSTVSPVIRVVDTGGTATTGLYTSQAIINGNPAMSYYDSTNQNLMYVRALDADGTTWGTPVAVETTGNVGQFTSLAVVNGRPAISYYDVTNQDLKYVQASDADGAAWGTPVPVDTSGNVGSYSSLEVVNGRPAISYADTTNGDLRYVRALDADGAAWGTSLVLDTAGTVGNFNSLAVVEGMPAISYANGTAPASLKYIRASDADGATWGVAVTAATGSIGQHTSLQVVNGSPAISYYAATTVLDLRYVRATDTTGTAWGTPLTLDSVGTVGQFTSLAIVRGTPAISYYDSTNTALKYVRSSDVNGAVWDTSVMVENDAIVGQYTSLAVVNGDAAISYYDTTNGDLKWARLETVFVTPPEIAVQQPAGADLPSGGSRDFGGVALGGSADLTFTILNTSDADLKLTGAPKAAISGSSDFSVTAQPASPVFGPTGSTTFTVRFAPTGSGAKTAMLTIASNDPDEGSFTISLTGKGLLSLNAWRLLYFGSATENIGDTEDFDSDGVVNLLEFAFGSHPASSASGSGPLRFTGNVIIPGSTASDVTSATPTFLFVRCTDFASLGLTHTVRFSADLLTWETATATPTVLADDGTNQVVGLTYPLMRGGAQAKFGTVGVSVAP